MAKTFDWWLRTMIVLLVTLATFLLLLPFVQSYYVVQIKLNNTNKIQSQVPNDVPTAETIHALKLRDLFHVGGNVQEPVGRVLMPSVGLADDVYVGLTNKNLGIGAVAMFPKRTPDRHNIVLLGHNVGFTAIHFGVLEKAKVYDNIYLNYLNHDYQYEVVSIETINEKEIVKLKDTTESQVSLVTCSAPTRTPLRILVRAKLVKKLNNSAGKRVMNEAAESSSQKQNQNVSRELWVAVWLPISLILICYISLMIVAFKIIFRTGKA